MPLASLSLDLDNAWSYLKTHGDPRWQGHPSYLDALVPCVLEMLAELELRLTFFVVGQDAALAKNRAALAAIGASAHEVGCHSFHHEPWLHLYSPSEIDAELAAAELHIEAATRRRPEGFRGPGFSLSEATLQTLVRRGYRYDASTLPTFIGPLARAYYFLSARLDPEERRRRARLFGGLRDGARPLRPYRWRVGERRLLELPVTTFPLLRIPIHASYVLFLSLTSERLAWAYLRAALRACRGVGIEPSILLHPLDFLGREDAPELAFFPAMRLDGATKRARIRRYLEILCEHFEVLPMGEFARRVEAQEAALPLRVPRFAGEPVRPAPA